MEKIDPEIIDGWQEWGIVLAALASICLVLAEAGGYLKIQ